MSLRPFEPRAFYDLALYIKDRLSHAIPRELKQAADRTCVSRAYYATFLLLRDAMLALPIRNAELRRRMERTNDAHAIVAEAVRGVSVNIGDYLLNLRRLRNKADYETKVSLSSFDVTYAFEIANEVIGSLTMIVKGIRELDIDLAWRRIQERRARRGLPS